MKSTSNSSAERFYFPNSRYEVDKQRWTSAQASRNWDARFAQMNEYIRAAGDGWIVSVPGREVTIEVLETSTIPDELDRKGYRVRSASPPIGERIVANARIEHVVAEGSSKTTIRTLRE